MKKVFLLVAAAAVMAGCQTEKVESPVPELVKIVPVVTKATDVNFENGDKVGVTIMQGETAYATNELLTYGDNVFSGTLKWYPEALTPSTITAYYPYASAGAPSSFTVATDQTKGYTASDLIAGKKEDVTPSVNAIVVPFKHMLTKISLEIDNQSQANIASVELRGAKTTADVDLTAMTAVVSESSSVETVKAFKVTDNALYSAIVVPQTVAFEMAVTTSTGKELTQKLVSSELKQGMQYTIKVKVLPADIKVSISGEIEGWGNGGEIGGDVPAYIDFAEYDGYFIYKNEKYNTVKLSDGSVWMAQPMRYVPEGYTVSSDPKVKAHIWAPYTIVNGVATPSADEALINKNGYLYDMCAALGVSEITKDNAASFEGAQGICPNGWHVPTRTDYLNILGYSNSAVGEASGGIVNDAAVFYDASYKGAKIAEMNAAGWNFVLTGWLQKTSFTGAGKYFATAISDKNSTVESFYGNPSMTYLATSTVYKANESEGVVTSIQFFAGMTTFVKSSYPEGRVALAFQHCEAGSQLRCVKNK